MVERGRTGLVAVAVAAGRGRVEARWERRVRGESAVSRLVSIVGFFFGFDLLG